MMYHLAEQIEADKKHTVRGLKNPFSASCVHSNDQEIRDHMIKHVENVLVPEV